MGSDTRLLLINPPLPIVDIRAPDVATTAGMMPPMGLLALAAYVKSGGHADVRLLDLQIADEPLSEVKKVISGFRPHVAGITGCLFTLYDALKVARVAREAGPDVHICMGGHHASVFPAETAGLDAVDSAVFGEGEITLAELLAAISNGKKPAGMAGLACKNADGNIVIGPEREIIRDIDSLPMTDRSFLDASGYTWVQNKGMKAAMLFAGRGCPFKCSFCFNVSHKVRLHSPAYVVEEMKRCASEGFEVVNFYDETFNINRRHTLELAAAIKSARPGVEWTFRGRCDVMDDELARELAASGCKRINFGIEAGTNETLKTFRKEIDVDMARKAVRCAARTGIEPVGYFIIGAPHETQEQCMETIRFACSLPLGAAQFMILFPLPGTEIYERALAEGGFEDDYIRRWAAKPDEPLHLRLWNTGLDEPTLVGMMRIAYRRFYMNPRYIARQFLKLRSFSEFMVYARAALSIFGYVFKRGGKTKQEAGKRSGD